MKSQDFLKWGISIRYIKMYQEFSKMLLEIWARIRYLHSKEVKVSNYNYSDLSLFANRDLNDYAVLMIAFIVIIGWDWGWCLLCMWLNYTGM